MSKDKLKERRMSVHLNSVDMGGPHTLGVLSIDVQVNPEKEEEFVKAVTKAFTNEHCKKPKVTLEKP